MQWTGHNAKDLSLWSDGAFSEIDPEDRQDDPEATGQLFVNANRAYLAIVPGEWVIKDQRGFYPCKPDIFAVTHEKVE